MPGEKKASKLYERSNIVGVSQFLRKKPTTIGEEVLLKSSIADLLKRVDASREKMKRNQREIDRLRVATDKILSRLRAA